MAGDDKKKQRDPIINGIAGMGAGGVSVLVTQPADVIKTRMQGHSGHHGIYMMTYLSPSYTARAHSSYTCEWLVGDPCLGHGHAAPAAAAVPVAGEVKAAPTGAKGNMISVGFDILRKEGPMFFYAGIFHNSHHTRNRHN